MTLEGPRVLDKLFHRAVITNDEAGSSASIEGGNWEQANNNCFIARSYYDLSGYTRSELTSFYAGVDIQEQFGTHGTLASHVVDLITTEHLSTVQITNAHPDFATSTADLPGFLRSVFDMNQVVYGRCRTYNTTMSAVAVPLTQISQFSTAMWGTCSAATADKVHLTRIIYTAEVLVPHATVTVPPSDYVTSIVVGEEDYKSFIMRQKRSYELATQG